MDRFKSNYNNLKMYPKFQMSGKSPDCNELLTIFVRTRWKSSHLLTSVDSIGSIGQDLTIAATRLLTSRCIFGGDDQRAFLNCMARLLKLAKSVHILGMPVFFHPV